MNDNKSRDIFYGVVAVATLIVALIGATLAYFSMNVSSEEGAVSAKAAVVSVVYEDGQRIMMQSEKLIPTDFDIVQSVYERNLEDLNIEYEANKAKLQAGEEITDKSRLCKSAGYEGAYDVCSVYRFSIKSDLADTSVVASLRTEDNEFKDLAYAVAKVDMTNHTATWLSLAFDDNTNPLEYIKLDQCGGGSEHACYTETNNVKEYDDEYALHPVFGFTSANDYTFKALSNMIADTEYVYDVVIFILNKQDQPQDYDQGKTFSGTILVETNGNNKIEGRAD